MNLLTTVASTKLKKEYKDLCHRRDPNGRYEGRQKSSPPPTQLHPHNENDDWGVSEDLCRHDRKRASCLQPQKQTQFQFLSLNRMA
jgi:hypothetical protein